MWEGCWSCVGDVVRAKEGRKMFVGGTWRGRERDVGGACEGGLRYGELSFRIDVLLRPKKPFI